MTAVQWRLPLLPVFSWSAIPLILALTIVSTGGARAATLAGGTQLWVSRYNGPANGDDEAAAMGVSPAGARVFVTGTVHWGSSSGNDYGTVALSASTGKQLWGVRYNGPDSLDDSPVAMEVSPDGSAIFVTGVSYGLTTDADFATVAYTASTGARRWVSRYNNSPQGYDRVTAMAVSPDGSEVFVAGYASRPGYYTDYLTVAYSASTGTQMWVERFSGLGGLDDAPSAVTVSRDGSDVYVTGGSVGLAGDSDYTTVAYSTSTGSQLWVSRYNGPGRGNDDAHALGTSPDGTKVFVTGSSLGSTGSVDMATVSYDPHSGAQLSAARYEGPSHLPDVASALAVSPDGSRIFVTGYSTGGSTSADYATVSYDPFLSQDWVRLYNGTANLTDVATAVGVNPGSSEVFVTGRTSVSGVPNDDYGTVAYDIVTGAIVWGATYDGPGNDTNEPTALAVSPDGAKVFVTGKSTGSTTGLDWATVAYST